MALEQTEQMEEKTSEQEHEERLEPKSVYDIVSVDMQLTLEQLRREDTQFGRRTCVRVSISYVEALVFSMKSEVYQAFQNGKAEFTDAELAIMLEKSYELSSRGKAKSRPYFASFDRNVRFAFDVCARAHDVSFKPCYSAHGWGLLQKAVKIRNRITHPKTPSDLIISDEEMEIFHKGIIWFQDNYTELKKLIAEKHKLAIEKLEEKLKTFEKH